MTYSEFMDNDMEVFNAYVKAMNYKRHNDAYINGAYIYNAIMCGLSCFGKHPVNYPDEPYYIKQEKEEKAKQMSAIEKDEMYRKKLSQWR